MQLYYCAAKKYKKPIPAETGKQLKYVIKGLLEYPEKPTQAHQEHREENKDRAEIEHEWMGMGRLPKNTRGTTD